MIDKLEYLIALAREKHFGRAAEACHVSQPTLSSAIRQLEDALGAPLVERGSRFIGFTAEGEKALDWARRIVGDHRAMRDDVASMRRGLTGHLRLAVIPTALPMVSRLTTAFSERWPDVKLSIFSRNSAEALRLLENLEIDACLTYLDNEPLGKVAATPLYRERYHLVTGGDGPFAGRETITWAEVGRIPLCLLTPDMQNRRIIDHLFAEVGLTAEAKLESNSIMVLAAHVRTGRWSSVMPRILAEALGLHAPSIAVIPIVEPEEFHTIGLVTTARDLRPPLIEALTAEARRLAPSLGDAA
ncbi:LysR family transcriptional regulator [Pinisolibacter aquiterrae]|jgi:DNA-binding transcriptional LysR family regulator|uniref:LysR family transcriptional regulator n=1 Tax=Pinisolibacter aquiterrae TaxID=2815579 RepID=UPI001C3E7593|nr:LysR substrate-binding domain-containing protein [Pinisolibacter aquiterrae]MBV5263124.1 LysR family transcriptional regulator [Pinisolibacter aquiterrae]MCC8234038.1 LysR family transcriptional regulator [Pinisolibacter aquiterrae]